MIHFKHVKVLKTFSIVLCIFVTGAWCDNYGISNCSCGLEYSVRGRIFGGTTALESEFPWQVALYENNKYFCGGSIINNLYILSAGHCFEFYIDNIYVVLPIETVSIVLGGHNLMNLEEYEKKGINPDIRQSLNVIMHPSFEARFFHNDISIVRMMEPLTEYSFKILPICLPPFEQSFDNFEAIVSGWGALYSKGNPVKILRKTNVKILTNLECETKLQNFFHDDIMLCAASPGHDACDGDSGGPLITKWNNYQYMQVGIVSLGIKCGNYFSPGIYARVSTYLQWIKYHTSDAIYCQH